MSRKEHSHGQHNTGSVIVPPMSHIKLEDDRRRDDERERARLRDEDRERPRLREDDDGERPDESAEADDSGHRD